jgi:predicted Fe-S protein YdhL (DUF1289 family)
VSEKQRKTVEVPGNWNEMTDEQKHQWTADALAKLAKDVGISERRRASKKR